MVRKSLVSTIAASLILSAVFAPTAMANNQPSYTQSKKFIYLNGKLVTNAIGLATEDPNTHQATTYMPIWYVLQTLKHVGVKYTWDGRKLDITPAPGMPVNLTNLHPGNEDLRLSINGTLVDTATRMVERDPYSRTHVYTTYTPIWYVQYVLQHMGVESTWDGTNWEMKVNVNPVQKLSVLVAAQTVRSRHTDLLSVNATYADGSTKAVPVDQVTWTTNDATDAFVSPSGGFIATKPGAYTVTAQYQGVTQTVQIQVSGPVDPTHSSVTLTNYQPYQSSPVRNGTGTLTVVLKDTSGVAVTGQASRLTATASETGVSVGNFTESSPGTYTAQVTATSNQLHVTITVKDGTISVSATDPFNA
jgi:hypothetical protein